MEDNLSAEEIENKLKKLQTVLQVWLSVKREDEGEQVDTQPKSDDEHQQKIKTVFEKREALFEAADYLAMRKAYLKEEKEYLRERKKCLEEQRQFLSEQRKHLRDRCLQRTTKLATIKSKLHEFQAKI